MLESRIQCLAARDWQEEHWQCQWHPDVVHPSLSLPVKGREPNEKTNNRARCCVRKSCWLHKMWSGLFCWGGIGFAWFGASRRRGYICLSFGSDEARREPRPPSVKEAGLPHHHAQDGAGMAGCPSSLERPSEEENCRSQAIEANSLQAGDERGCVAGE
jgi:hypothetical protein